MRIFIMRHTEAQPPEEVDQDEDRTITVKGEKKIRKAAKGLRRLDIFPERILSSPLKRALQTSEIIADELGFTADIEAVDELSPESPPEEMIKVLRELSQDQIILIGHLPLLGDIASGLIGIRAKDRIVLKKGGLLRIDIDNWDEEPPGQLRWLFTVKQLGWMRKKKKKSEEGDDGLL